LKIATWNVNGIRAREAQLLDFVGRERPDVLCLQEIKAAPDQLPPALCDLPDYWCFWHGVKGYSGVGLHVRKQVAPERPEFSHPPFDFENRIVTAKLPASAGGLTVASVYVPNGGKDFPAKMRFLEALAAFAAAFRATGAPLVLCGDVNVARTEIDVYPGDRDARAIGQLPEERLLVERLMGEGLGDVLRDLHPHDDALYTWWAPWRNMRARNRGWRIDYVLASQSLARTATACTSQREFGTSDHAPVVATFAWPAAAAAPASQTQDVPA
jgi:exodeoxyribonuclease III